MPSDGEIADSPAKVVCRRDENAQGFIAKYVAMEVLILILSESVPEEFYGSEDSKEKQSDAVRIDGETIL